MEQEDRTENSAPKHSKILKDDINRKKKVSCLRKERFGTTEKLWLESLKLCLSSGNKTVAQSVHSMSKTHTSIQ